MKFWKVVNQSSEESELIFYGEIRDEKPWWSEGRCITPDGFLDDVKKLAGKSKVTVRINSGGGDIFAATAIATQLRTLRARTVGIIDGLAASAATIITCALDEVQIPANGMMMIHNPKVVVWDMFEASDLEMLRNSLVEIKRAIMETYMQKTKLSEAELSQMMDSEKWMTGREAVEIGFADEVLTDEARLSSFALGSEGRFMMVNSIPVDLSAYRNPPRLDLGIAGQARNDAAPARRPDAQGAASGGAGSADHNKNIEGNEVKMTLEEMKKAHPELAAQLQEEGRTEGQAQERARLMEIDQIANTIRPDLLEKARYKEGMDAKTLAFENAKLEAQAGRNYLNDAGSDGEESQVDEVDPDPKAPDNTGEVKGKAKSKRLADFLNSDKRRTKA